MDDVLLYLKICLPFPLCLGYYRSLPNESHLHFYKCVRLYLMVTRVKFGSI